MDQARFHRALVVANPAAGRGRARSAAAEVSRGLAALGIENETHFTTGRGDAIARVRDASDGFDLIVSLGGDGTLREVLEGLAGRERTAGRGVPVAVLPFGTANVLSLDLGLPRTVDGLLETIARGRTVRLDTARVNSDRLTFLVTSVGFDAMAVHELEKHRRGPTTKRAYVAAGVRALLHYSPPKLGVEIDGELLSRRYALVIASNIVHYAGFRVLADDVRIDDGLFEVYLFEGGSRASLLGYGLRGLVSGLPGGSCERRRARRLRITSDVPVPCQVDGDSFGETPVEIAVDAAQARLVVP